MKTLSPSFGGWECQWFLSCKKKTAFRTEDVAQLVEACLTCRKPWVQSPALRTPTAILQCLWLQHAGSGARKIRRWRPTRERNENSMKAKFFLDDALYTYAETNSSVSSMNSVYEVFHYTLYPEISKPWGGVVLHRIKRDCFTLGFLHLWPNVKTISRLDKLLFMSHR